VEDQNQELQAEQGQGLTRQQEQTAGRGLVEGSPEEVRDSLVSEEKAREGRPRGPREAPGRSRGGAWGRG
jgi:hypothetical protein